MSTNPPANATTLGNGLVEIAALTALIGSTTAESLILGSRGAAGLPWASSSAFGSLFLTRACIAAATPSWLRDTLGVRNPSCDAAVGLSLNLRRGSKGIKSVADAVGIRALSGPKVWYLDVHILYKVNALCRAAATTPNQKLGILRRHNLISYLQRTFTCSTLTQQGHYSPVHHLWRTRLCSLTSTFETIPGSSVRGGTISALPIGWASACRSSK
jgi:hypothetical protein